MQPTPLTSPNWSALRLYMAYWKRFPKQTTLSFLFSITLALNTTVVPLLIALTLGNLIRNHWINVALLIFTGCFQLVMILASYLLDKYGVAYLHHYVEERLYEESFEYLTYQDYSFFSNKFSGSIVTQASRFAKSYTIFNDVMFFDLFPQFLGTLIAIGVICYYSLIIGISIFCIWLLAIFVVVKFALGRMPMRRTAVAKESELVGELADVVTNALTVKTFAAEKREMKRYETLNRIRGGLFLQSWHRAVRNIWTVEVLCTALQMVVLAGGIYEISKNNIGVATFLLFQVYILRIIENIRRSSMIVRQLEVVAGDAQEMTELLDQPPLLLDAPNAKDVKVTSGSIDLDHISFTYSDESVDGQALFTDFTMKIQSGEKVGLVGPSGGGKSTLTRLLLRFMDINDGEIRIGDHALADITQGSLRRAIAYVPQEPLLFHRSIKDNIAYGKPDATDEEIIAVSKKAYAHDFIEQLSHGYDTLVGERGVKLSGGQRQRVAIARAMLREAPILVLDEATSALDSESEKKIQKALWILMKDKTAVVIAHRLSTIARMDRIVVIDNGKIVEDGTHAELLKKNGLYARLWSHQSGGFIEE